MNPSSWDMSTVQALSDMRTPGLTHFFAVVTEIGGGTAIIIVFLVALLVFWRSRQWKYAAGIAVSLGGSMLVSEILKHLFMRSRPPLALHAIVETGYSFPSNHATAVAGLYGFLAFVAYELCGRSKWLLIAACIAIILLVGFSRVYLGVHYPSDVIGGYCIGFIFAWLGRKLVKRPLRFTT